MVSVTVCAPLEALMVSGMGVKLHVVFTGRFVQENWSVPVYPPTGVTVNASVTVAPGATLNVDVAGVTVTEALVAAVT